MGKPVNRPVYVVRLRPLPRVDGPRQLRAFLKTALRHFKLQCLGVTREAGK